MLFFCYLRLVLRNFFVYVSVQAIQKYHQRFVDCYVMFWKLLGECERKRKNLGEDL